LILQIALDTPLRRVFDYLPPVQSLHGSLRPGVRVRVPFGRRQIVGILVGTAPGSLLDPAKLKRALEVLDEMPVFDAVTFELLRWAADYYHHPIGEVLAAIAGLPGALMARMSGSGATCFGIFADDDCCERAAATLREAATSWWVAPTFVPESGIIHEDVGQDIGPSDTGL